MIYNRGKTASRVGSAGRAGRGGWMKRTSREGWGRSGQHGLDGLIADWPRAALTLIFVWYCNLHMSTETMCYLRKVFSFGENEVIHTCDEDRLS